MYLHHMKISLMTWSWILRGLGMLSLLPAIFPHYFLRMLPGLEPSHFQMLLLGGTLLFVSGAVTYHIARKQEKEARARRMKEDGEEL